MIKYLFIIGAVFFASNVLPFVTAAQTTTTISSCPNLTRTLARGSYGADVVVLQQYLISQNFLSAGNSTGYFGVLTEHALQQWQSTYGVVGSGTPATTGYGVVGPKTRSALARCNSFPPISSQISSNNQSIPTISCSLNYSPSIVTPGQNIIGTWSSIGATSMSAVVRHNGIITSSATTWPLQGSSIYTLPSNIEAGTYEGTLTATGPGGTVTCKGNYTVSPLYSGTIDVFLIAGQSNAVGYGDISKSPLPPVGIDYQYFNNKITAGTDPVGPSSGSAWPAFAISYNKATGHVVGFVPVAVGQTGQSVKADSGFGNWDTGGALFTNSITTLNNALQAYGAAGFNPIFKGVLWAQGENDGSFIDAQQETALDYVTALKTMIGRYQATYGSNIPFYIFQTGTWVGYSDDGFKAVRDGQQQAAATLPNTHIVFTDAINFPAKGWIQMPVGVHYTQDGYNEMGAMGGQNVATSISSPPFPTCSLSYSPSTIAAGQNIVGTWTSTGATSMSAVVRHNGTTISSAANWPLQGNATYTLPSTIEVGVYEGTLTATGPGGSATCYGAYTVM